VKKLLIGLLAGSWLLVAVLGNRAVDEALDGRSAVLARTVAIVCWTAWGAVGLAIAIPSVRSLTVVRVIAPLALVATGVTALTGATAGAVIALAVPAVVAVTILFSAEIGQLFVQASAYGDEQRLPLRAPAAVGAAALLAWVVWAAIATCAVLAIGTATWALAVPALAVLAVLSWFLPPRWHRLSRRWLVFVPAGLVLHDPVVLADTLMLRHRQVGGLRLAPADTGAADLTGPASGYAVEVATTESVTVVYAPTPRERSGRAIHLTAFLVAPSRPGRALAAATERRLPVG
jgi:hypothetical protein